MTTILVVDDSLEVLEAVADLLDLEGFNVVCTGEIGRAAQLCCEIEFDLVICDLYVERQLGQQWCYQAAGLDLIWRLKDSYPSLPLIAMSGVIREELLQSLRKNGVKGILRKPFDRNELLGQIGQAISLCPPAPALSGLH